MTGEGKVPLRVAFNRRLQLGFYGATQCFTRNGVDLVAGIFLSYRRDDAQGEALHLFDDLRAHFGADQVFMDVTGIDPGKDFRKAIDDAVGSCDVLIVVIGKKWLDSKDDGGRRRLDNPEDFVRMETAAALRRQIPVIPVLVQGMVMPPSDQLPGDLEALVWRSAFEIRHVRWEVDVAELLKTLGKMVIANSTSKKSKRVWDNRSSLVKQKWTIVLGVGCLLSAMTYVLWADIWPLASCFLSPGGTVISLPRPVEGGEAEPNSHISQANQIELGKTYQGSLREGDSDYFVLQTPNASGRVIRFIARIEGGYMEIAAYDEKQERIFGRTWSGDQSDTFRLRDTPIHLLKFSSSYNFVSYEFELRPEPVS